MHTGIDDFRNSARTDTSTAAVAVVRVAATTSVRAGAATAAAVAAARERQRRSSGLTGWAVHTAHDGLRVATVETWRNLAAYGARPPERAPEGDQVAYRVAHGSPGLPLATATAEAAADVGTVLIDVYPVPRPLLRPVAAFNVRNGGDFAVQPGCLGTTVLVGIGHGRIATYARWRRVEDFTAAFSALVGRRATTTAEVNAAARRRTFGILRPDYHAYSIADVWSEGRS